MGLIHLARQAFKLTPAMAITKGGSYVLRIAKATTGQLLNFRRSTFVPLKADFGGWLCHDFSNIDGHFLAPMSEPLLKYATDVTDHRFDLLGSGPVCVKYGVLARGFEGTCFPPHSKPANIAQLIARLSAGNRQRALAIRNLIDENYKPIDWQLDFISGYRWSEKSVAGILRYGHEPGVDIKVPWELARLQHLPALALAYCVDPQAGYDKEFRNQVLDFAAANPPGYGVNWMCTMDVAIRAASLVVAMDMFRDFKARFDAPFLAEFQALIEAHGKHVMANLEWHAHHRGNHYLANISGLLFIAAYLPASPQSSQWLELSIGQLITEVERQFTPDGANFEGSTSYHRLSCEMVICATALILGPQRTTSFPSWYFERLERMAEFSMHITKPNGRVAQIGDNDSGRFLPLGLFGEAQHLDHSSAVGAVNALFGRSDFTEFADNRGNLTKAVVSALANGQSVASYLDNSGQPAALNRHIDKRSGDKLNTIAQTIIELPDKTVLDGLQAVSYPDFGLFIWRSRRFFLSVRCGPIGQNGNGGHAHNDQLAIELNIDGQDWIADPGTYVYTPAPHHRDAYRSVRAHGAPKIGKAEPARLTLGMFRLEDSAQAKCSLFNQMEFEGSHMGYGGVLRRRIIIEGGSIKIIDESQSAGEGEDVPAVVISSAEQLKAHFSSSIVFSPGYGLLE